MLIKQFIGGYDSNIFYILSSRKEVAVIDCFDANIVLDYIKENNLELKYIISTHSHFDHVEANKELKEKTNAKIVMYKSDDCDLKVDEGDELKLGNSTLKILYTPGHDMDCICILADNKFLFTGDTLFVGTVGKIFCHNGEKYQKESLKRLMKLDDNIIIYPGHDYGGESATIKEIKQINSKVKLIL